MDRLARSYVMEVMKRFAILFLALFALVFSAADASAKTVTHAAGDPMFVEWSGSWWKATAIAPIPDGRTVIHYVGWSEDYDEVVKPKRIRNELKTTTTFALNEAVFVEWKGSYWAAHVTALNIGSYKIHYDGYGPEWDEGVAASRIVRLSPPEG